MSGTTPPPAAPQAPIPVPADPLDKTVAPQAPPTPQPNPEKPGEAKTSGKSVEYAKGKEKYHTCVFPPVSITRASRKWGAKTCADVNNCSKLHSEYFDPCQEAADRSLRCLHRNPDDKNFCADYFQYAPISPALSRMDGPDGLTTDRAYRDCKKRWQDEQREEKRKASGWTWW
jgi:cytochrome c oxidase assembly protein subunit 23